MPPYSVVVTLQRSRTNRPDSQPSMAAHEATRCLLLGSSSPLQVRPWARGLWFRAYPLGLAAQPPERSPGTRFASRGWFDRRLVLGGPEP